MFPEIKKEGKMILYIEICSLIKVYKYYLHNSTASMASHTPQNHMPPNPAINSPDIFPPPSKKGSQKKKEKKNIENKIIVSKD